MIYVERETLRPTMETPKWCRVRAGCILCDWKGFLEEWIDMSHSSDRSSNRIVQGIKRLQIEHAGHYSNDHGLLDNPEPYFTLA